MATLSQQREFLKKYSSEAKSVASETGDSENDILGQWALETGWGSGIQNNNLGNLGPGESFSTPEAGAQAYAEYLKRNNVINETTPTKFSDGVVSGNYDNNNPEYGESLISVINSVNKLNSVGGSVTGPVGKGVISGGSASNQAGIAAQGAAGLDSKSKVLAPGDTVILDIMGYDIITFYGLIDAAFVIVGIMLLILAFKNPSFLKNTTVSGMHKDISSGKVINKKSGKSGNSGNSNAAAANTAQQKKAAKKAAKTQAEETAIEDSPK